MIFKSDSVKVKLSISGETKKFSFSLNGKRVNKIMALADYSGTKPEKILCNLLRVAISRLPNSYTQWDMVPERTGIVDVGIEDGYPFVRLENGRILLSHFSSPKYSNLYYILRDCLPSQLSVETYGAAVDAGKRYRTTTVSSFPHFPGEGGVIVEVGAYTGHRAVGFSDIVGDCGKVIAIEIMRANYEILCRNIEANNLKGNIFPFHCAVANKSGTITVKSQGYHKNTIVDIDRRDYTNRYAVPAETLDNILDKAGIDRVDLMNIQINGAELQALEGLSTRLESVKILRIASYYENKGIRLSDKVCSVLEKRGCKILSRKGVNDGNILAVTKPYVHEI